MHSGGARRAAFLSDSWWRHTLRNPIVAAVLTVAVAAAVLQRTRTGGLLVAAVGVVYAWYLKQRLDARVQLAAPPTAAEQRAQQNAAAQAAEEQRVEEAIAQAAAEQRANEEAAAQAAAEQRAAEMPRDGRIQFLVTPQTSDTDPRPVQLVAPPMAANISPCFATTTAEMPEDGRVKCPLTPRSDECPRRPPHRNKPGLNPLDLSPAFCLPLELPDDLLVLVLASLPAQITVGEALARAGACCKTFRTCAHEAATVIAGRHGWRLPSVGNTPMQHLSKLEPMTDGTDEAS